MTPLERAEKIASFWVDKYYIASLSKDIAAQIEEAIKEDREVACNGFEYEKAHAIEDARAAALEEAAKIAEDYPQWSDPNDLHGSWIAIANRLRALIPKERCDTKPPEGEGK